jgi:hypothetical protein
MIEEENRSRIAANTYSNENEAEVSFDQNEAEIFANSFQIESKTTNSFVNDNLNNQTIFDSEEESDAIASEDENLDQRHMMTKALSIKNLILKISRNDTNESDFEFNIVQSVDHVIDFELIDDVSQSIMKLSSATNFNEKSEIDNQYESAEEQFIDE